MEGSKGRVRWIGALALGLVLGLALSVRAPGEAQSGALPRNCSSGQVVVSDGSDRFRCVDLDDLLRGGDGCYSRAVVALDSFGDIECVPLDQARLPECPHGSTLVSRGVSGWECGRR